MLRERALIEAVNEIKGIAHRRLTTRQQMIDFLVTIARVLQGLAASDRAEFFQEYEKRMREDQ